MANTEHAGRKPGRPRVGDKRLQLIVPQAAYTALLKIERETELSRTRAAVKIICQHLGVPEAV